MHWQTSRFRINLDRPKIMGIVNITPDSFSDGGRFNQTKQAIEHCHKLLLDGADLLDLGAESTRPGAVAVSLDEELARLIPVLKEVLGWGVPISVDTYKSKVMRKALELGADIINDIWACRQPGSEDVISTHPQCGVCLMHMHRDPQTMQLFPMNGDVVTNTLTFLKQRSEVLHAQSVHYSRICVDVGIGFGKTVDHNFQLLNASVATHFPGQPVLAAWSRKSSLGAVTGQAQPESRVISSVVAAILALDRGAQIVRVHDVAQTLEGVKVWVAMKGLTDRSKS